TIAISPISRRSTRRRRRPRPSSGGARRRRARIIAWKPKAPIRSPRCARTATGIWLTNAPPTPRPSRPERQGDRQMPQMKQRSGRSTQAGATAKAAKAAGAAAANGVTAENFVTEAAQGDLFELESSRLALERSDSEEVLAMALKMLDDHTTSTHQLL